MNGFINEKVLPPIMKFLNTKPMVAIKNGMIYPIPFIIVGSVFLILGQLPIQAAQDYLFSIGLGHFSCKSMMPLSVLWRLSQPLVLLTHG